MAWLWISFLLRQTIVRTDSVLKAISEPKTDPNTPMMEIDWIRFYTNSTYSDEGVTYWANAGQLFY